MLRNAFLIFQGLGLSLAGGLLGFVGGLVQIATGGIGLLGGLAQGAISLAGGLAVSSLSSLLPVLVIF